MALRGGPFEHVLRGPVLLNQEQVLRLTSSSFSYDSNYWAVSCSLAEQTIMVANSPLHGSRGLNTSTTGSTTNLGPNRPLVGSKWRYLERRLQQRALGFRSTITDRLEL